MKIENKRLIKFGKKRKIERETLRDYYRIVLTYIFSIKFIIYLILIKY